MSACTGSQACIYFSCSSAGRLSRVRSGAGGDQTCLMMSYNICSMLSLHSVPHCLNGRERPQACS